MAGPLHHHLRRDATGERQADESTAAGMGGKHFILGESLFHPGTSAEAYPGDGLVEATQFSQILQVLVHLLVADDAGHGHRQFQDPYIYQGWHENRD